MASALTLASPVLLGLLPEGFQFLHRNTFWIGPALVQALLHPLKAAAELAVGLAQRGFGIEREIAGDIDQHEKKVAYFSLQPRP